MLYLFTSLMDIPFKAIFGSGSEQNTRIHNAVRVSLHCTIYSRTVTGEPQYTLDKLQFQVNVNKGH